MTHKLRTLAICLFALTLALPTFAAGGKRRSVVPTAPPVITKVVGTVTDAGNGRPIVFATVSAGELATTTDAAGKFELEVPGGTVLTITRSGYQTVQKTVPNGAKTLSVTMSGLPTIHVKTTTKREYDLDTDSSEFAYLVPFSGYVKSDEGKFCKPNGDEFKPSKSIIKRFIGPATTSTSDACCKDKTPLKARVELKSGEQTDVFFSDSCFGYEVDFIGRDHFGGDFVFLKFTDIAEITFP